MQSGKSNNLEARGKAFVVYEDIFDAKTALDALTGYNFMGRYLQITFHKQSRVVKKVDIETKRKQVEELRKLADA